jgi:hypothetical protein
MTRIAKSKERPKKKKKNKDKDLKRNKQNVGPVLQSEDLLKFSAGFLDGGENKEGIRSCICDSVYH